MLFDVGANVGQTTLSFIEMFPNANIYSFEPCTATFRELVKAVARHQYVKPINLALGPENTTKKLITNKSSVMNSFLEEKIGWGKVEGSEMVNMVTLDSFAADNTIEHVDVLKIDAQGYDLEVLKGGMKLIRENRVRLVFIEINFVEFYSNQANFEDVYVFLRNAGFKLTGIYEANYQHTSHIWFTNALFINPAFAQDQTQLRM